MSSKTPSTLRIGYRYRPARLAEHYDAFKEALGERLMQHLYGLAHTPER